MNTEAGATRAKVVRRIEIARATAADAERDFYDDTDLTDDADFEYVEPLEHVGERPRGGMGKSGRAIILGSTLFMLALVMAVLAWLLNTDSVSPTALRVPGDTSGLSVGVRLGQIAPEFELVDARTNKMVKLSSLRGKPVFINFWGTWCPPCRAEMPEMQKVYNKYKGQFAMVGISMGPRDTSQSVKSFVDSYKYDWTFLQDDAFNVANVYQAYSIPTSYFIDPSGVIRAIHIGAMDSTIIEGNLAKAR